MKKDSLKNISVYHRMLLCCAVILSICTLLFPSKNISAKETDCRSCHGYRTMAAFNKGVSKPLYIDDEAFKASSHGKAACTECHEDFNDVPHKKERRKTDCTKECHIIENGVDKAYSHKGEADAVAASVHSRLDKEGRSKKEMGLIPDCEGCHPFDHKAKAVAADKRRLHALMSKDAVIGVCGGCHMRPEVISKFNLSDAAISYNETFHGKQRRFGRVDMPDCIDCHADPAKGAHLIKGRGGDKTKNIANCKTGDCHPSAGDRLNGFHVHVSYDRKRSPVEYYVRLFFRIVVTAIVFSLLTIAFLELLRRLFPAFSFFKKKDGDKEA